MKLVRLLALELYTWPDCEFIVQDASGQCWPSEDVDSAKLNHFGDWTTCCSDADFVIGASEDYKTAIVTKDMWLAEKESLKQEVINNKLTRVTEIEGLPAIGSKMIFCAKGGWGYFQDDYPKLPHRCEVEILAHMNTLQGDVAVFKFLNEDDFDDKYYMVAQALAEYFKPLPTEADILKEKNLDAIYGILGKAERPDNKADMAQAIYDAGFRPIKEL